MGMNAWDKALAHVGARPHAPEEIIRFFGRSADKIFFELLKDKVQAEEAYEIYFQYEKMQIDKVHPHHGIVELLENLKNMGARLGVVTGRHSRDLELLLSHTQIAHFFDVAICDNFLTHPKPHPEGIQLACSRLGIEPVNSFYIGDSVIDLQAAKAAGAKAIAALWDEFVDSEKMKSENPQLMARTPGEIYNWICQKV
jgi:pyrophosphatase PpaX